ncbi:MAG: triose-phosphate isomerase [Chloroflexota bacterium]
MTGERRVPIVAGNWKMNTTLAEAFDLAGAVSAAVAALRGVEVVVCPPFVSLAGVRERAGAALKVGAQNAHQESKGAFTGEVSVGMLAGLVDYVIVGHSERRQLCGETDEVVKQKLAAVLAGGLTPILCVGETLAEREAGATEVVLRRQVSAALAGVSEPGGLVVAYEPVWAIGTGRAATVADANGGCAVIRDELARVLGRDVATRTRIQYGGSVSPDNARELLAQPDIDGALVGSASLKADSFAAIVAAAAA